MIYKILEVDSKTNLIKVEILIDDTSYVRYFNVNSYIDMEGLNNDIELECARIVNEPENSISEELEPLIKKEVPVSEEAIEEKTNAIYPEVANYDGETDTELNGLQ